MTDVAAGRGYRAEALGVGTLVLFGLAYLTPLVVLGTFGIVAQAARGATASSYLVAVVAMVFTAASYGRMASRLPVAGSAYAYVSHALDRRAGFMVGWAIALDYFFIPMVTWLIGAAYLHDEFPGVPMPLFVLGLIVSTTWLNIVGFKVAKGAYVVLMVLQGAVLLMFSALAVTFVHHQSGLSGLVRTEPFWNAASGLMPIASGAAIAAYSFLGFDAVTTLSEESHDPRRTLPVAIWTTVLLGGAIFVVVAWLAQLAHPGFQFKDVAAASSEISAAIGGKPFTTVFVTGMLIAQYAAGAATQAAGARLVFAMARDGVLPRRLLGTLSPKFGTPVGAVLLTGAVGLLAMFLSVESSTSFINFGAFSAFTAVNLAVIATGAREVNPKAGRDLFIWYVAPAIGAVIDLWLLTRLEKPAILVGLAWLCAGFGVLAYLTRGFSCPPPALHMEEH